MWQIVASADVGTWSCNGTSFRPGTHVTDDPEIAEAASKVKGFTVTPMDEVMPEAEEPDPLDIGEEEEAEAEPFLANTDPVAENAPSEDDSSNTSENQASAGVDAEPPVKPPKKARKGRQPRNS